MLADPTVGVVYISTTNERHCEQAISAARAGKHVLCEKPMALTVADAEKMVTESEAAGVVLAVNHQQRGTAVLTAMRSRIESGAIGTVLAARIHNTSLLPPEFRTWRLRDPEAGAARRDGRRPGRPPRPPPSPRAARRPLRRNRLTASFRTDLPDSLWKLPAEELVERGVTGMRDAMARAGTV